MLWHLREFFMYLPHVLHRWHVWCYVHRSIQHLFTRNVFCPCHTTIKLPTRDHIQSLSSCLVTQVHVCLPYLKAVHYAQTNVTFPAEIQCGPCLLLQRTHMAPTVCSSGRPVLRMLYFQSTELVRSCTWSAPRNATSCHIFLLWMDDQFANEYFTELFVRHFATTRLVY